MRSLGSPGPLHIPQEAVLRSAPLVYAVCLAVKRQGYAGYPILDVPRVIGILSNTRKVLLALVYSYWD